MIDEIHIVINRFDLSDDFNRHAAATIASILEHCSKPVHFHITHEGKKTYNSTKKSNDNIERYEALISKYVGSSIEFHDIDKYIKDIELPKNILDNWSSICLSRLVFQNIFPNLHKIILLGADTIVLTDLAKVLEMIPESYSIAAIPDMGTEILSKLKSSIVSNQNPKNYFNADVCIFNLDKIRLDKIIIEKANEYFSKINNPTLFEQDTLNYIFQNNVFYLPARYNIFSRQDVAQELVTKNKTDCIIHFAGSVKPWDRYTGNLDNYYWEYVEKTPWCNNKADIYNYIRLAPDTTQLLKLISKNIFRYIDGSNKAKLKLVLKFLFSTTWNALIHILVVLKKEIR